MKKSNKKRSVEPTVVKSRKDTEEVLGLFYCKGCKDVVPQRRTSKTYTCSKGHLNKENVREIMNDMNAIAQRMKEIKEGTC